MTLVMFAILATVVIGLTGLVIDTGLLMTAHRQAQNAADAAALAGAYELMRGGTPATAETSADTFVKTYNGLTATTGPYLHIPPTQGPYAGQAQAVEAVVNYPRNTLFIQVLGAAKAQTVQARAVAQFQDVPIGVGLVTTTPTHIPGLKVGDQAELLVHGGVAVNSEGGGVDQNGVPVNNGFSGVAADGGKAGGKPGSTGGVFAPQIRVVGGVNDPKRFQNIDPQNPANPLKAKQLPETDPLANLPTPYVGNGVINKNFGDVSVKNGDTVTFDPGIYTSMKINGGTVQFNPGIYVLAGGGLNIGKGTVAGNGVMFYNTGADYNPLTGAPDSADPPDPVNETPPPAAPKNFGKIAMNADVDLTAINTLDPTIAYSATQRALLTPFNGMLYYQRRANTEDMAVKAKKNATTNTSGSIYAKWAKVDVGGTDPVMTQVVVGSLSVGGKTVLTINFNNSGVKPAQAPQVFLVN